MLAMRVRLLALLCAVTLTLIPGALVGAQVAHAAPQTTFYGVADSLLLAAMNAATDTATSTALTATDTPTASATATNTPSATDTPTDTPTASATPTIAPTATPTGPAPNNYDLTSAATAAGWPQANGNWCGIATVALIANFLGNNVSQNAVAGILSSPSSASEWGTAPPAGYGPGVTADIAADFGTDPRSLAYGMTVATGRSYHMVVDTAGAWDTTINIVNTVIRARQPVSVFVDHGQHSVVVSGVDATGDPLTNPSSITAIHVWDPGNAATNSGIQKSMHEAVPLNTWLSGFTDLGGSDYFKYPYSSNPYGGIAFDPDPSVGPYTYVPALYNHLWIGHYVYISPFGPWFGPTSPDWAVTPGGALIAGEPTNGWPTTPQGYTGAVVPMPTNPPPPPPPVHIFSKKPLPKPIIKVVPKPTPSPTPQPTPRPRRSPTPIPTTSGVVTLPVDPVTPQTTCAGLACALASLPPLWGLGAIAALLVAALLLALAILRPRYRRRAGQPALAVAEAPILPAAPDSAVVEPGATLATTQPALPAVEPAATPAVEPADDASAPVIVPVLEADAAPEEPETPTGE